MDATDQSSRLLFRIRALLGLLIAAVVASGITALPLLAELRSLASLLGLPPDAAAAGHGGLAYWVLLIREGLSETYARYPFMPYGTDWVAFGHFASAVFFLAAWRDPVRNIAVLRAGIVVCILVVPMALIAGQFRSIPIPWRLIDCSFGLAGLFLLGWIFCLTRKLARLTAGPPSDHGSSDPK